VVKKSGKRMPPIDLSSMHSSLAERRSDQLGTGWIGVDFDGTVAEYHEWMGWNVFGSPIMPMVYRIRRWLGEGHDVRVLTARIGVLGGHWEGAKWVHGEAQINTCRITGSKFSNADMARAIAEYTEKHVGAALEATCIKDLRMIELWDDRAIQVEPNTGRTVFDEFEAEAVALRGKP
jgi:hypothetical protein